MRDATMGRRVFLEKSLVLPAATVALVTLLAAACAEDPSTEVAAPDTGGSGVAGAISANHGHTVTVTDAELSAAGDVTLTVTTRNGHTHTLFLTASRVAQIATAFLVGPLTSSKTGHTHNVTFNGSASAGTFTDTAGSISANHSHTVTILGTQLEAGGTVSLLLTIGNSHTHTVQVTSVQVAQIWLGSTVGPLASSDTLGHTHNVTFN